MLTQEIQKKLNTRIEDTEKWLSENGGECKKEQRHLIEASIERTYWHYGYMMALKDVLRLLFRETAKRN